MDVQTKLTGALTQTLHESEKSEGIHSIVRLLALKEPAKIPELNPDVKNALETDLIYTELVNQKGIGTFIRTKTIILPARRVFCLS